MSRAGASQAGCALAAWLLATQVQAGHGLINSFAGIAWLPDPGTTPTSWWYPAELLAERAELAAARTPESRLERLHAAARERIAECEAVVRAGHPAALPAAFAAYRATLEQIDALVEAMPHTVREARRTTWATTLLEHRYIVSTDWFDLPRSHRGELAPLMEISAAQYVRVRERLPRRRRDSLFFKEEEVRWSWEQAQGADAQGL
ncbi:MAG: DUF5667 domain-containing protein [Gammaproteobacteria bacterium]